MSAPGTELPERTRVLVIGGGPVGLVVSCLLSAHGIEHVVVERRAETQRAPAAHVLRRRPMQLLDGLGVGDEVRRTAPGFPLDSITWCTTLGGREVGRLDLRPREPATGKRPAEPWTNCPQNLLEPILLRSAASRPPARILRGAECVTLDQTPDGVVAEIRTGDAAPRALACAWAIAADGAGSPTRRALDIAMEGPGPLARFAMVHFEADLRPWIEGRSGPIFWLLNPESPGALITHDPRASHVWMMPRRAEADEAARIPERLAASLGVPVVPRILSVDAWAAHVQVAARYREGRVLLVGDAAHRFPPTGGLGLNTGIAEAADLVARLVEVEAGRADVASLDDYERVCRPIACANAEESFANMKRLGEVQAVLGAQPDLNALERRLATLTPPERDALANAIEAQRSHFLSDGRTPPALPLASDREARP